MGLYPIRHLRSEWLKGIGEQFKIDNYSNVSSIIERFKARLHSDPGLTKRVDRIRRLVMSQGQTRPNALTQCTMHSAVPKALLHVLTVDLMNQECLHGMRRNGLIPTVQKQIRMQG